MFIVLVLSRHMFSVWYIQLGGLADNFWAMILVVDFMLKLTCTCSFIVYFTVYIAMFSLCTLLDSFVLYLTYVWVLSSTVLNKKAMPMTELQKAFQLCILMRSGWPVKYHFLCPGLQTECPDMFKESLPHVC